MAIIPIPEIEAELILKGALKREFLRDPHKPRQDGSLSFLLIGGLPRVRTVAVGLEKWIAPYLSPDQVAGVAALPKSRQWATARDDLLTDDDLIDLAHRLGVGQYVPQPRLDLASGESTTHLENWWKSQAKAMLLKKLTHLHDCNREAP